MNIKKLELAAALACGLALAGGSRAQEPAAAGRAAAFPKLPDASPACVLKQRVGLTDLEIDYSRPSAKPRQQVFGGIVPYGILWRTGDNASTKIKFDTPVKLNGVDIPPGMYALYTIPDEKAWTVILYKDPGLWGAYGYTAANDFARLKATPVTLTVADTVPTFTFEVSDIHDDSAVISLTWGRVRVPMKLEVDIVGDLLAKINLAMSSPGKKPAQTCLDAATFYFNHSKDNNDLTKELLWVNEGLVDNPPIAYQLLYLKAEILARSGDSAGAMLAARQSMEQAIQAEGPGTPYVKMNTDVMSGLGR
jgi:hypothetical protein